MKRSGFYRVTRSLVIHSLLAHFRQLNPSINHSFAILLLLIEPSLVQVTWYKISNSGVPSEVCSRSFEFGNRAWKLLEQRALFTAVRILCHVGISTEVIVSLLKRVRK